MTGTGSRIDGLRAGAARADITPKAGTHLGGDVGSHRPAQSVLDPLYAKVLAVEGGGKRVVIVALDLVAVGEYWTDWLRQAAAERFGLDRDAIVVHAIQTHSAPSLGHFMFDPDLPLDLPPEQEFLLGGETGYYRYAAECALDAIGRALDAMRPVRLGYGRGLRHDLAFNRRVINRAGRVVMPFPSSRRQHPVGNTDLLYAEGPADPEVGVLCLREDDLNMVAMLLSYTCHPVNVYASPWTRHAVSADWPGAWSAGMREAFGGPDTEPGCVPLVLNGCCGNVNPWDPFEPDFRPDHRRMGAELARTAREVVAGMDRFEDRVVVDFRSYKLPLEYREVPPARLAEVEKILGEHPQPLFLKEKPDQVDMEWYLAASTRSIEHCRQRMPRLLYEIQVLRLGDAAFVALPGEPFTEGQLAIKLASPASFTQVLHMTSQYVGYVPTRESYRLGGHENNPACTYWAKLAPGSLESITETAVGMLNEMFG